MHRWAAQWSQRHSQGTSRTSAARGARSCHFRRKMGPKTQILNPHDTIVFRGDPDAGAAEPVGSERVYTKPPSKLDPTTGALSHILGSWLIGKKGKCTKGDFLAPHPAMNQLPDCLNPCTALCRRPSPVLPPCKTGQVDNVALHYPATRCLSMARSWHGVWVGHKLGLLPARVGPYRGRVGQPLGPIAHHWPKQRR